ncbi:MAG: 3-phosphoshikimate 1-carboxyvinyltransferase [Endozoicomonadaceae bacterium]|nr:3-phosphoshikimate 1-carboxyvinyltransferase [Endozoicomonadaceae bacterium]
MTALQTIKATRPLTGEVSIPSDKSISHRALMLSAISDSIIHSHHVIITNLLESEDVFRTLNALRELGVEIRKTDGESWIVKGVGLRGLKQPKKTLYMGNSGTTARLLMGVLAGQDFETVIDGDDSLRNRPMKRVTEPLTLMGARFEFLERDGYLPIKIIGNPNLKPLENYEMPVASAQIKSAILLAGLYADGPTTIKNNESRNHTEFMMTEFNVNIGWDKNRIKLIPNDETGIRAYPLYYYDSQCKRFTIPADPSSAAFFVAASMLVKGSEISLSKVCSNYRRIGFYEVLRYILGCKIKAKDDESDWEDNYKTMTSSYSEIQDKEYVVNAKFAPRMIDEYPILTVLASGIKATTTIKGIEELRVKECDRIDVMVQGLRACGVKVESGDDWMKIYGTGKVKGGATIATHSDHRIAMSFVILGLIADEPITIDDIEPVKTSFPTFFEELKKLGIKYK